MKVLLVCMGNICRSPSAEGVLRHYLALSGLAKRVFIDSAGTYGYHVGAPPDARAQKAAIRRGIDISRLRARPVEPEDFERFDMILAMDRDNLEDLRRLCPPHHQEKIELFMRYSGRERDADVPDPYYGGPDGFERVLDMIEDAARGLADELRRRIRDEG
ncbi:MAG: low molecular weight protein-tyrosine-phosphatase [Rhodocyclaceae bacterium]